MVSVRFFHIAGLALLSLGLSACAGVAVSSENAPAASVMVIGRVIVKFRDPAFDPTVGPYLAELSGEFNVTLVYVRPMSGGAHVLQVADANRHIDIDRVIEMMRKRDEVLYAERDRLMRAMEK